MGHIDQVHGSLHTNSLVGAFEQNLGRSKTSRPRSIRLDRGTFIIGAEADPPLAKLRPAPCIVQRLFDHGRLICLCPFAMEILERSRGMLARGSRGRVIALA